MRGEVSRFSASMIKLIWSSTQILQLLLKPVPRSMPCIGFDSSSSAALPATKSPFLLMTNQNQTSLAPHPQNQPPDSGSVHGSQRQQLWLSSLDRSHRVRSCVSSVFCLSPKDRSGAIDFLAASRFSRPLLHRRPPKQPISCFGRRKKKSPIGHPPKPICFLGRFSLEGAVFFF